MQVPWKQFYADKKYPLIYKRLSKLPLVLKNDKDDKNTEVLQKTSVQ